MTDEPEGEVRCFVKQGRSVREVLQAVENALVNAGKDEFVVATERGTFQWQTFERARTEIPWQPGDELEH